MLGDTINYIITVANTGDTALTGVSIIDTITDDIFDITSDFGGATQGSAAGMAIGENDTASFAINTQAVNAGGVSNTVQATATSPSGVTVNDISDDGDDTDGNTESDPTVTLTDSSQVPSIEVTKTAVVSDNGDGITGLGDTINYIITVANTGDTALTGVSIIDTITDLNGVGLTLTIANLWWCESRIL